MNCLSLQTSPFQNHSSKKTTSNKHIYPRSFLPKSKPKSISFNFQSTHEKFQKSPPTHFHIPSKIHHPLPYSSLIQSCIDSHAFDTGKSIHNQMLLDGLCPDTYLQTKIIMLYCRSGDPHDLHTARLLFDEMPDRNSTTWNTMILAYSGAEDHVQVLELFYEMQLSGILPDRFTYPSVVKACIALEDDCGVRQVHGLILRTGWSSNLAVGGALVDAYARFGSMDDAVAVFNGIDGMNTVAWNAIISGYVKLTRCEEAWAAFCQMHGLGLCPDHFSFATAIRVCGTLRSVSRGKQVHAELIKCGFEDDVFVGNSLIDMHAKCGDEESCLKTFNSMAERDQVTWNSIISAQAQFRHFDEVMVLFKEMKESGYKSDQFNLGSIIMACACLANVDWGRELHGHLIRNILDMDVVLGSALVNMYSKCDCVETARQVFERLQERNEVSWNAMIAGYVQQGQADEALELFQRMKSSDAAPDQFTFASLLTLAADQSNYNHGKQIHAHIIRVITRQNIIIETELVHMYAKRGNLKYAQEVFNRMLDRNAYTWNSLIVGFEQNGEVNEALEHFHQMQLRGIKPGCFSLASMLSVSIKLFETNYTEQIHGFVLRNGLEEDEVLTCMLVDAYSTCGVMDYACKVYDKTSRKTIILHNAMISAYFNCSRITDAKKVFNQMDERSIVSWNSMIAGYAKCGLTNEAFKFFKKMHEQSIEIDESTLVAMFNLCAELAALERGKQLHGCTIKKGLLHSSVVLNCSLVDMYAKGGAIEEARRVFDMMNERNVISWNAMIAAYAKHGLGKEVLDLFDRMQKDGIYPNEVTFLSILSACSHTGLLEEGLEIFISMLEEHGVEAGAEHYTCIVDLLGRAGRLDDAEEVIRRMPIEPEVSTWGALLGACRVHQNVDLGRIAVEKLFKLDPRNPGHYILMANIYAAAGRWVESEEVRSLMKARGVTKDPGISWVEIDNEIQIFHAGDQSHSQTDEIYAVLKNLLARMKGMGYVPDTNFILLDVKDLKEDHLLQHSERLAIALGLICLPKNAVIRIFKNLRICGDCHAAIKLISKITARKIIIRDTKRFHHFEDGLCSCGDYW